MQWHGAPVRPQQWYRRGHRELPWWAIDGRVTSVSGGPTQLLCMRGIAHGYRNRTVLHGVDVCVDEGEVVALLGPNGAGKTTLLKVAVGTLAASDGDVVRADGPHRVGWVPQGDATWQRLTVRENLRQFVRLMGLAGRSGSEAVAVAAARRADLEPWLDVLATELSGGLRQRLSVAVGLLGDPRMIVLDEPTTGVDIMHRAALFGLLAERANAGCGVLFSTHSVEDARMADRLIVLTGGRVVHDGTLAQLVGAGAADDDVAVRSALVEMWGGDGTDAAREANR